MLFYVSQKFLFTILATFVYNFFLKNSAKLPKVELVWTFCILLSESKWRCLLWGFVKRIQQFLISRDFRMHVYTCSSSYRVFNQNGIMQWQLYPIYRSRFYHKMHTGQRVQYRPVHFKLFFSIASLFRDQSQLFDHASESSWQDESNKF